VSQRDREAGGPGVEVRRAVVRVLSDVRRGSYADRAAAQRFRSLAGRDRALGQELAYGTIRLRKRLDGELSGLVDRPLRTLDPSLLEWLRLGLYQLRETRIPPHAAVHATVEGARAELGRGPAGLANAVLRRAVREPRSQAAFPDPERSPEAWLAAYGSVTLRMLETGGADSGSDESGSDHSLEPLPDWPGMVRLVSGDPARALRRGNAIAQDPAASAVVEFVGSEIDGPVLDACAAPGGKAAALARLASRARPFVAADIGIDRIRVAASTLRRTGSDAQPVVMDARRPAITSARTVLLDAPCSGTGVLRRRPDARWRISERRLDSLRVLQADLLDSCADLLEPGGLLVYATCSLEPEENQAQVERFLARQPGFRREPPTGLTGRVKECLTESGDLEVLPFRTDTDGAFASRLRKGDDG
jgi:16S rRNA (cytosine967-C5)-methyltransferase